MKSNTGQNTDLDNLSLVASSISQSVIILGADDKVIWVNKAFEDTYGFTLDEVIGNSIVDYVGGPEMDPMVLRSIEKAIFQDKLPYQCELIQYKKDKTTFWGELNLTPILDSNGNLEKYISVVLDITDRKNSRAKLEAAQTTLHQVSSSINDVFYLYNIRFKKYEFISPNSLEIMGAPPSFFYEGNSYNRTFGHPEDLPILEAAYESINRGIPYEIDYRVIVNEKIRWIREKSFPIVDLDGNLIKNSGVCQDITEVKRSEEGLVKARENAKLLSDLGLEISAEIDISNIVEKVFTRFKEIMDLDCFGIGVVSQENNALEFPLFVEKENKYTDYKIPLTDENKLATICLHRKELISIKDSEIELVQYIKDIGPILGDVTKSIIYLPLFDREDVVGVLTIQSFNKNAYDSYSLSLVKNLSVFISVALKKAMLYKEMEGVIEERTQELKSQKDKLEESYRRSRLISEIGYTVTSSLNFEEIFVSLYNNVRKLMKVDMFGVRIINKEKNTIDYRFEIEHGERQSPVSVSLDEYDNYSVWCVRNNMEILIKDNRKEYKEYVKEIKVPMGEMPNSLAFYPLVSGKDVIGVITVQSMDFSAYGIQELDILKSLASYTASAITKAMLYDTLEHKVIERTMELQEINRNILDSINYAKRIHDNIQPRMEYVRQLFPKSMIYFKPKDIISGDFYLVDEITSNGGLHLKAVVVGDCTGHGVPGGILSVLCSNLLKQTFRNRDVNSPSEALNMVSKDLTQLLATNDNLKLRDGMDVAFCVIDEANRKVHFAGANNSCFILRSGKILRLRGDRQHVGYNEDFIPFRTVSEDLEPGDRLYLTTDGYIDQFGGENYKKFMLKNFLSQVIEIHQKPFEEQFEILDQVLTGWKGENEQTDDICVFAAEVL
ncbi:MAG: SpoIIE family protein phosphatase [Flavobacteriales bacterium]|nr:SpoIIE family protein phosphatase [Flavobacteriales bacterium]MCB9198275.1 SpoIIE family protein phosphatase [Flavobacteriales bacterium]